MRTVAVIQARMRSTRLPGKVLMPLGGRPVLGHIVNRLRRARTVGEIAITTSNDSADDAVVRFGAAAGVPVFRGQEDDVLGRFEIAARALQPDIIVRVTGDSPLIDPELVDFLVGEMARTGGDFLVLEDGVKCIQEGVDPFSRRALEVLLSEARGDPIAQEHVTGWMKAHPERVRVARIAIDPAYAFSGARLSIDTPADLAFYAALAERVDLATVSLKEIAALLRREPWLLAINAHVHQKPASQTAATVLIRADGGGRLGYGHLTRSLALAEALRDREGIGVLVLTGAHADGDAQAAREFCEARRIPVQIKPPAIREFEFIFEAARRAKAAALVLDVRTTLAPAALDGLRVSGLKLIAIDDASARRLKVDIAVYPPVPQALALCWDGFGGELLIGGEWVLISSDVARRAQTPPETAPSRLLIAMGGSDVAGLSEPIARACADRLRVPVDVVIGPGVGRGEDLAHRLVDEPFLEPHFAPIDPSAVYAHARLAITSFGVTAYELAALGVPALYVALTDDHRHSALGAEASGFGRFVSMTETLDLGALAAHAASLWFDESQRAAMSKAGRRAIDGQGARRLARRIAELIGVAAAGAPVPRGLGETRLPNRRPAVGG
jgi:spore coat polysaccharide biosynthesis protein SpsF